MSRLIRAEELLDHLYNGVEYDRTVSDGIEKTDENIYAYKCGWNEALKSASKWSPTVDAVEVVRCKDCKWHEDEEPSMVWCPYVVGSWVDENGYCSWGERSEDVRITDNN